MRTGDTSASERRRIQTRPPDVLITTPESLYLMLTSQAREMLRSVRWVIVDEIHAMAGSKRGAHLALSLERLEELAHEPPQRIGLSATQRPLEEIARFLGGQTSSGPRPVTIVDAGLRKPMEVEVVVPVEDMADLSGVSETPQRMPAMLGPATPGTAPPQASIWPAIHPQVLELIRAHRSTIVFVNARRLAERLAARLNELAGEELARAHHGSIAREQRLEIEDQLKRGTLKAIVATSSLELGIDMGAVDLVIQVESPGSVARGLQRIGRAGHQVGEPSRGKVFPKFRGDLLEATVVVQRMLQGAIEETHYPRNPLDVVAQQIVAMCAMDEWTVADLGRVLRRAANFEELSDELLRNVLDLLAGRYPSDEFAELRPRIVWDRRTDTLRGREGAGRLAIASGGTIPDRGLFGVFTVDGRRVGELDEEMVYESRRGEVFMLGASSWRIEDITLDRVVVSPAPGEPGKMPFWHGDKPGRPLELGRAIGVATRELSLVGARRRRRAAADRVRPGRARGREPHGVPRGPARGDRRRPRRPHDRGRALPRRDRRLAGVRAVAVRRAGARAVGDGDRGPARRTLRARRPGAVERRRHRDPPARVRGADPGRGPAVRPRRDRGARGRAPARDRAVHDDVPGGRRPRAAAPPPDAGAADAAVAAAAARRRPARGGLAPPDVPDPARGDARGPARRVRRAGAQGGARRRPGAADPRGPGRHDAVVAVRAVPALPLGLGLHVRGRRPDGRAARGRALARPRAPARAARRRGPARADRPGRARRARARAAAPGRGPARAQRRRRARPAPAARAT